MDTQLAPLALWLTPLLLLIIGVLIGGTVRYFLAHMVASMGRIEARLDALCKEMRDNYVTHRECEARRASMVGRKVRSE